MTRFARIRRTLADRRGSTAVEFAVVLLSLLLLLLGILEFGIQLAVQAMLDFGAREASRVGVTGYAAAGIDRETYIRQIVAENTYGLIDQKKLVVVLHNYDSFTQVGSNAGGAAGPGGSKQVAVYSLYYTDDAVTGLFANSYRHEARVVVRNEPYPG